MTQSEPQKPSRRGFLTGAAAAAITVAAGPLIARAIPVDVAVAVTGLAEPVNIIVNPAFLPGPLPLGAFRTLQDAFRYIEREASARPVTVNMAAALHVVVR